MAQPIFLLFVTSIFLVVGSHAADTRGGFMLPSTQAQARLEWDNLGKNIDADLSATLYDSNGMIYDYVGPLMLKGKSKLASEDGAISHHGDSRGHNQQNGETLSIALEKCASHVNAIVIFLNCHEKENFGGIETAQFNLFTIPTTINRPLQSLSLGQYSQAQCLIAGILYRNPIDNFWWYEPSALPCQNATTTTACNDIIQDRLETIFQHPMPGRKYINDHKDSFILTKGIIYPLGKAKQIKFGLGWDPSPGKMSIDLDANVTITSRKKILKTVFFQDKIFSKKDSQGETRKLVCHGGDNLTGDGDGDDEVICVNLKNIDELAPSACHLVLSITCYSEHGFDDIAGFFCRVANIKTNQNFAVYKLDNTSNGKALILADIFKDKNKRWQLRVLSKHIERYQAPIAKSENVDADDLEEDIKAIMTEYDNDVYHAPKKKSSTKKSDEKGDHKTKEKSHKHKKKPSSKKDD